MEILIKYNNYFSKSMHRNLFISLLIFTLLILCKSDSYSEIDITEQMKKQAIDLVKYSKLSSGRTMDEELSSSFPSLCGARGWEAYQPNPEYQGIIVIYVIRTGKNYDFNGTPLIFKWQVGLKDNLREIEDYYSALNDLTQFITYSELVKHREDAIDTLDKKEVEIFMFLSENFDREYTGKKWMIHRKRVLARASKRFKMSISELEKIYNRIEAAVFGDK